MSKEEYDEHKQAADKVIAASYCNRGLSSLDKKGYTSAISEVVVELFRSNSNDSKRCETEHETERQTFEKHMQLP